MYGLNQPAVNIIVCRDSTALASKFNRFVGYPDNITIVKQEFYA